MSAHTPEPWQVHTDGVETCADGLSPISRKRSIAESSANKERRVACVNACAGINPEAVPGLLDTLREIEKGEGRFSTDNHQHAINTIEDMKKLARVAVVKATS